MEGEKAWVEAIATEARIMERREWFMVGERIQGNKIRVDHCIIGFVSCWCVCAVVDDAVVTVCTHGGCVLVGGEHRAASEGRASTQKGGKVAM